MHVYAIKIKLCQQEVIINALILGSLSSVPAGGLDNQSKHLMSRVAPSEF